MLLLAALSLAFSMAHGSITATAQPQPQVKVIHEFPNGTWIENMAIRPSGSVLAVDMSAPNIYDVSLDGTHEAKLIHTFSGKTSVSGIAKIEDDNYLVVAGNFTFTPFSSEPGTYSVYHLGISERSGQASISLIGDLPSLTQPNGILAIPNTKYLLIADSILGKVYRYDTTTRELTVYLDHPLLKPAGTNLQAGVNGIKFSHGYFYFSNTNQEIVARILVTGSDYMPLGEPELVASQTLVDDFIVDDCNGDLFLAENGLNSLAFLPAKDHGTVPEVVAGAPNSTELAGPTAVVWTRSGGRRNLVVSSTGGLLGYLQGKHTIGGRISLVYIDKDIEQLS